MDIQKIAEEVGKSDGLSIKAFIDGLFYYLGEARNVYHSLLGHNPGEGKIYDVAIVALMITTPFLVLKPIIKFAIKLIAFSAGATLLLLKFYPMPTQQLIMTSLVIGLIIIIAIKAIRK
ncbi:MAG: hypothetical protein GY855_05850 [candidate division Zixibacteria bacterium]|nr:hypothetical protein [candidate division Zixibacteria bacterium]